MCACTAVLALARMMALLHQQYVPVTVDGPHYHYAINGDSVLVSAKSDAGLNEREFFWDPQSPVETNSTVCEKVLDGEEIDQ
jgi:hypothetical protein